MGSSRLFGHLLPVQEASKDPRKAMDCTMEPTRTTNNCREDPQDVGEAVRSGHGKAGSGQPGFVGTPNPT